MISIAHAQVRKTANPDGPDIERYALAFNQKAADLVKQWADFLLFARFKAPTAQLDDRITGANVPVKRLIQTENPERTARGAHSRGEAMGPIRPRSGFRSGASPRGVLGLEYLQPSPLGDHPLVEAGHSGSRRAANGGTPAPQHHATLCSPVGLRPCAGRSADGLGRCLW